MSKFIEVNEKIADKVVDGYKKIENGVVGGYKKIETGVVEGFERVSDKYVEVLFAKEGVKGCIAEGADADMVVLNEDLDIVHVMAKGVHAADQGKALLKGRFER